jgi:uncharacterized protein with PQ loop repeat
VSWIATAGALLLGAATLPEAVRLLRRRSAADVGWLFAAMNATGLALLTARSVAIEEWAFVAVNTLTTLFWTLVLAVKVATELPAAAEPARA